MVRPTLPGRTNLGHPKKNSASLRSRPSGTVGRHRRQSSEALGAFWVASFAGFRGGGSRGKSLPRPVAAVYFSAGRRSAGGRAYSAAGSETHLAAKVLIMAAGILPASSPPSGPSLQPFR